MNDRVKSAGKVAVGAAKIASGFATASGRGVTPRILKTLGMKSCQGGVARQTVQSGTKLLVEGIKELRRK